MVSWQEWLWKIASISFGVVGAVEFVKGYIPKAPSWVWRSVLLLACFGAGVASEGLTGMAVLTGLLVLAFAQIGYQTLLELPKAMLEKIKASISSPASTDFPSPKP